MEAARPHAGTDGCLVLQREENEPADARLAERDLRNSYAHKLFIKKKKNTQIKIVKSTKYDNVLFFAGNIRKIKLTPFLQF